MVKDESSTTINYIQEKGKKILLWKNLAVDGEKRKMKNGIFAQIANHSFH